MTDKNDSPDFVPWPSDGDKDGVLYISEATGSNPDPDNDLGILVWTNEHGSEDAGRPFDFVIVRKSALPALEAKIKSLRGEAEPLLAMTLNALLTEHIMGNMLAVLLATSGESGPGAGAPTIN